MELAINLFRSLQLNIFIYYFVTVSIFLGILHFLLNILELQNTYLVAIVLLSFVSYSAIILSNLAIDPLKEYVFNLQNLSKETLHELNLPISTIKTNSQMMKKNLSDEKALKRLQRIDAACIMLEQRYNELEYMIKTQTSDTIKEELDLEQLIERRIHFLSPLYPQVNFNTDLQPTHIVNDSIGLSKVIDNLIDNAVKYSPNSNTIDIKLHEHTLSIQDYGCGMDEVALLSIFDNYYQSDRSMQGFGIGLSLVKRFCDKQGIQLSFKSKENNGTTVILKFQKEKG